MPGRPYIPKSSLPIGNHGMPVIQIKPWGNWDKTVRVMGSLGRNIKASSIQAQLKVCKEIQTRVKRHLRNQDLGWKRLGRAYLGAKMEAGLDRRILMSWGKYYSSIDVWRKPFGEIVFVGVKKGVYTKNISGRRSKLDVATIAAMHEFSSGKRFPRRQLWNPTIAEMGGTKGLKKMYVNSLYYWLRIKGVPISKVSSFI